jgi:glucan biosynthesis protein C
VAQTLKPRLFFIDNVRAFLITLVILQHLAITYGAPSGLWYIHEGTVDLPAGFFYIFFLAANQAFFMGLLFLFAGYFTAPSYDRKGSGQFFADRALRLGLPIGIFIYVIDPIMKYALTGFQVPLLNLLLASPLEGLGFGPLWFIELLLYFTIVYIIWRAFKPNPTRAYAIPSNLVILLFGLLLGAVTFSIRLVFPVGYSFDLLGFQFPFFPQYIALFPVGLLAYRGNWILTMPKETGRLWGRVATVLLLLMPVLIVTGSTSSSLGPFGGGWSWQALAFAFWEQLFCIAVSIGLTVWFREKLNMQNRFSKAVTESSYAAYILQAPVLVYLTLALQGVQLPLPLKFAVFSPIAVAMCFITGFAVRKIPRVDRMLKALRIRAVNALPYT